MKTRYNVAIIGATGIVGSTTLSILEERRFPINQLFLIASNRSAGEIRQFQGKAHIVEDITQFDFTQTQIVFFSAGSDISEKYAPIAAKLGNIVIDKSSYFRYHPDIPLVVPEVNESAMMSFHKNNIIANPNCNTIPIVVAIKPLYDAVGITRMNVATYQSVSGSGKQGVEELTEQTNQLLNGHPIAPKTYPQQIAFNVLPHIDTFQENGYTKEEMKIIWETQKILNDNAIRINPTAVRVPVFYGHSAALHIETCDKISVKEVIGLLSQAPGITVIQGKMPYPTAAQNAAFKDAVFVGRIREDLSCAHGINLWVVTDNLRKGAALNAVQIAEKLTEIYLQ